MSCLLDTGPLVAVISRNDQAHQACTEAFATLDRPPVTCWPVMAEAAYLLRSNLEHVETLVDFAAEGIVAVADVDVAKFADWLHRFFAVYRDQRPQLADAVLMYLAERQKLDTVFTLDRRDFSVFRTLDGRSLTIIP